MAGLTSSWLRLGARKILSPISFKMRKWVSPISRCLAPSLRLALRRQPRASSAVGRDNSSRRGRRAQGPAEARPRPTSASHEARARPLEPSVALRGVPCGAGVHSAWCGALPCAAAGRACRRSRSQRPEPAFLTRRSASRLHVPTSGCGCASCACALSCGANHGTVARACWGRRATGASPTSHGACLQRSGGPLRHPLALGRHGAATGRGARACCWRLLSGG